MFQLFLEDDGLVMLLVFSAVQEDNIFLSMAADQFFKDGVGDVIVEFGEVAFFEFWILSWVMTEPLAKFIAGADLFEPAVEVGVDLGDSAGPEAVNQDSVAVLINWFGINSFSFKHCR